MNVGDLRRNSGECRGGSREYGIAASPRVPQTSPGLGRPQSAKQSLFEEEAPKIVSLSTFFQPGSRVHPKHARAFMRSLAKPSGGRTVPTKGCSRKMHLHFVHFNGVVCSNTLFSNTSVLTYSLLFKANSTCKGSRTPRLVEHFLVHSHKAKTLAAKQVKKHIRETDRACNGNRQNLNGTDGPLNCQTYLSLQQFALWL